VQMVTAFIVWMNAAIFITFRQYTHGTRIQKYRPHYELMIGLLPIAVSVTYGLNVLFGRPKPVETVRTVLVQPNIDQTAKWNDDKDEQIRATLEQLTQSAARLDGIDLIIWPETALPDFLRSSEESRRLVGSLT